ncbi:HNH endonuclease [Microbulbifer sp. TYP-18]|uniref:HNH endonuclease n=1 Tax=Microbulbifer sp. TYP-18 TaxID=3230024 RepID=UPI0034C63443
MSNKLSERRINKFTKWLAAQGAEMLPTTNEYEVLRFRCSLGVGVIYRTKQGKHSVSGPLVTEALNAYSKGRKWAGKGKSTKRTYCSRRKQQLLNRDGNECFYCGQPLGSDVTEEHLVALNQGGPNRLENLVLAHKPCNLKAGNLPVMEKVRLREAMRAEPTKRKINWECEDIHV